MGTIIEGGQVVASPENDAEKKDALATSAVQPLATQPEQPNAPDPFIAIIEKAVLLPTFDVEKLERLLAVVKDRELAQSQKKFDIAMADFKKESIDILRNKDVSFPTSKGGRTNYSHATLDNVCEVLVKRLSEHGFRHRWRAAQPDKDTVVVTCVIRHESGAFEETTLQGPPDDSGGKNSIQAVGSTVTYLERYTLLAACGLAVKGQDTDGGAGGADLAQVACPRCGKIGFVIASKAEWGGGYVCYKKRGGCGEKFQSLPGEDEAQQATSEPKNDRNDIRTFKGQVLELTEKKKDGKPVLKLRLKGGKTEFWVVDPELVARLEGVPDEKLKKDGVAIGARSRRGGKGAFWEVVELQRVPPGSPPPSTSAADHGGKPDKAPETVRGGEPAGMAPSGAESAKATITDQQVKVMKGRGKAKQEVIVHWKRFVGTVEKVSSKPKAGESMQILVAGLPPRADQPNAEYVPYNVFRTYHASLFDVLLLAKGKPIDFVFRPEIREGITYQMIEEVFYMDGQKYVEGKAEIEQAPTTPEPTPPPITETASPKGLFTR